MPDVALLLRDGESRDGPRAVPGILPLAEGEDALCGIADRLGRQPGEAVVGVATLAGRVEQAAAGQAGQRRSGADGAHPEIGQQADEHRGRNVLATRIPIVAKKDGE
jgi:hypothetical protein